MIQPDFKTFSRLARQGNLVPVYETVRADMLTPVSAYLRLAQNAEYACLLESVEGGEKIARYTFVGANPAEVFRFRNGACILDSLGHRRVEYAKPIDFLRKLVARYQPVRVAGFPPLVGGAIGYLAYDMVRQFENIPDTGFDDLKLDDAVMMFFLGLVVFDHVQHRLLIVRNVYTNAPGSLRAKYNAAAREITAQRRLLENLAALAQGFVRAMHARYRQRSRDAAQLVGPGQAHPQFVIEGQVEVRIHAADILERFAAEEAGGLADEALARQQRAVEVAHRIRRDAGSGLVDPPGIAVYDRRIRILLESRTAVETAPGRYSRRRSDKLKISP